MSERTRARWLALVLLLVPFTGFAAYLDRYPGFTIYEPFYNFPAVNYLNGNGISYRHSEDTPYGDTAWAYNGPFYPRLQVATFALFGSSSATWRFPEFICGALGIGLLSFTLIRHGKTLSGVILPIAWAGDRSFMELTLARPDGVAMLFIIIAFLLLLRVGERRSNRAAFAAGLSIGAACGFHISAVFFVLASYAVIATSIPRRDLPRILIGFTAGGVVPLLAVLWLWSPNLSEHFAQLLWHIRWPMPESPGARLVKLFEWMRGARYWTCALLLGWLSCGFLALRGSRPAPGEAEGAGSDFDRRLIRAAFLFGAAGVFALLNPRARLPYYLIFFTCWPIVGLLARFESAIRSAGLNYKHALLISLSLLLFVPSLAYNLMRFREAVLFSRSLDHRGMIRVLRSVLPDDAVVAVGPVLLDAAIEAKLKFRPLPWAPGPAHPPPDAYLLLKESEYADVNRARSGEFEDRPLMFRGGLFPDAGPIDCRIVVLGPVAKSP